MSSDRRHATKTSPAKSVPRRRPLSYSERMEEWERRGPLPPAGRRHLPDFWGRACRLLVLLILFLIPTLYPLRLPIEFIKRLQDPDPGWWPPFLYGAWHRFYLGQLDFFVTYGYSPLPLKEGAFSILVLVLLVCWYIRQVGRTWSSAGPGSLRFDWRVYGPLAALLAWAALSLAWSPTFYYSLKAYAMLAVGVLWFSVVYEMPKNRRVVRRWFNMILLAGGVVAFFAFLQDVDRQRWITEMIFPDIVKEAKEDPFLLRLRMGSLIGHNIGVASFISFSWFILLARLFQPGPPWKKVAWFFSLAFLFYIIVALQTRGIWITLVILTPIHLFWLMRLAGPRWDPKPVLGAILIVLIVLTLQLIPSPRNPFYSPEAPLLIRLTHFTPQHLRTETRLRIAVCSLPLVAEKPLTGHGLGSFQYVFPEAQAEYFADHPDTIIVPGARRTMRAHNDWLQIMIELGLPGLLIVLAGLFFLLRRGLAGWSQIRNKTLRFELTAALMGVSCVLIHALGNFPLHVVSSAMPGIFLLAIWVGSGRIGRREEPPPESRPKPSTSIVARPEDTRRIATIGLVVIVPAAIGAASWFYSILHASMYETVGSGYRAHYGKYFYEMSHSKRRWVIENAFNMFKLGHKIARLDHQLTFRVGEALVLKGVQAYLESREMTGSDEKTKLKRAALRWVSEQSLLEGIRWLNDCQQEVKYHEVFHYIGLAHEHIYRLFANDPERSEPHRQAAKFYYSTAALYSPAFSRSVYHLFLMHELDHPPNEYELHRRCRQIAKYDPALFQRQFVDQVNQLIGRRDYAAALPKLEFILDAQPENPNHWLQKAHLLAFADRGAQALELLDQFGRLFPKIPARSIAGYRMEAALAAGDYETAIAEGRTAEALPGGEMMVPYCRCIRALALEKLGRPEAAALWSEIEKKSRTDPRYCAVAAEVLLYLERDTKRAYPYLMLAAESDPPPDAALVRIAAQAAWSAGEKEKAVEFLDRALELDPEDEEAGMLLDKWSKEVKGH